MKQFVERRAWILKTGTFKFLATYLGIGLIFALWTVTTWPKRLVVFSVAVFIQNMLLWPIGLLYAMSWIFGSD